MRIYFTAVKYLANLRLAIFLLLIIASVSIIGSVIEQNQTVEFYQKNYSDFLSNIYLSDIFFYLGLDHVFKTWWFITLLVLFGMSLTCCTFLQQLPALERVRKVKLYRYSKVLRRFPVNARAMSVPVGRYINTLRYRKYKVFQCNKSLYASKGLIGRVSPIIVHFSMVLILLGTILASTSGFIAQEFIPETEVLYFQNIINNNINTYIPQISGRVNDFWISYKDDLSIKQFYTDFSLIDKNGDEIKRETIYVNHPLKYHGLTFYQTDWNIIGFRIKYMGKQYQLPAIKQEGDIYASWIPLDLDKLSSSAGYTLLNIGDKYTGFLYDETGAFLTKTEINSSFNNLSFLGLIESTGIQIKADPGLALIYFGFFLLILSIFTSYLSYSQVWLVVDSENVNINGMTNRAKIAFEFEVLDLILKF